MRWSGEVNMEEFVAEALPESWVPSSACLLRLSVSSPIVLNISSPVMTYGWWHMGLWWRWWHAGDDIWGGHLAPYYNWKENLGRIKRATKRRMIEVTWIDDVIAKIKKKVLAWAGHVVRQNDNQSTTRVTEILLPWESENGYWETGTE